MGCYCLEIFMDILRENQGPADAALGKHVPAPQDIT